MSKLADLEQALIVRLAAAEYLGAPAFNSVGGWSGGTRAEMLKLLERERAPAALVAFTEEPLSPQTRTETLGARFTIFIAARSMRVGADPRLPDETSPGAFALMECARSALDDHEPATGLRLVPLLQRFIEADPRTAVYALQYRAWPIVEASLRFDAVALAGTQSRMSLELGDLQMAQPAFDAEPARPGFLQLTGLAPREIYWRGQLRAADNAAMNAIELGIQTTLALNKPGDVTDGTGRVFENCLLERFSCDGPRRPAAGATVLVQEAELQFLQVFSDNQPPKS